MQQVAVLQHPLAVQTPPMQVEGPTQEQHVHSPETQPVPSGLLLVTQPPEPSQTAVTWHWSGAQV